MAIIPIRNLGDAGVITDVSPYNLPLGAYSKAVNVRFDEGKVRRAPIFRTVLSSLGFSPRFAFGIVPSSGFDTALVVSNDYVINEYANETITNRSGSITGSDDPRPLPRQRLPMSPTSTDRTGCQSTVIRRVPTLPILRTGLLITDAWLCVPLETS